MRNASSGSWAIYSLLKIESLLTIIFHKIMVNERKGLHRESDHLYFDIYDTSSVYNILIYYYGPTVKNNPKTYLKTVVNLNVRYLC